jgi:hypothetical protein
MDKQKTSSGGISFCDLLVIVFIVLKLCKVITWSWLWVLAPIWIPVAIVLVIFLIGCISAAIAATKG